MKQIGSINQHAVPVFEIGGFINTLEGWNLYVKCNGGEEYKAAKAEWEKKQVAAPAPTTLSDMVAKARVAKQEATRVLADEIWPIRDEMDKASLILDEMLGEYFRKRDGSLDHPAEKEMAFKRNSTLAEILYDIFCSLDTNITYLENAGQQKGMVAV